MIKENGYGKMTLTNRELSQKIHMSESTISKVQRSLEAKNILLTIDTKMRDPETGLVKKEKIFDLSAYGQAIVFILKNHDERIADAEEDIVSLKKDMEMMKQEIMRLKKQEQKKDNTEVVL
jgi:DNA-binding MarR family transcriptional regulator